MSVDTIQCELWLMQWAETSNGGAKVVFQLHAEDLEPFKGLTLAKKGVAGQRFMAVLALLADDEQPARIAAGPLCRLAAIWCRDPAFQAWLAKTWPSLWGQYRVEGREDVAAEGAARGVVCSLCGVVSRKELDTDAQARRTFNDLIRRPFMAREEAA